MNHKLLILKLRLIGVPLNLIDWISSYLTSRTQQVYFENFLSDPFEVTSGVPQGSHLGPLLFLLFINDLPTAIRSSSILMYADDVKLFSKSSHFSNLLDDLNSLYQWCSLNSLHLNLSKCKVMSFSRKEVTLRNYSINNSLLERVFLFKDLGVIFDPVLNFRSHIETIVLKARCTLGFIKRWSKEFRDPYITKTLLTSLVRPILEYESVI